MVNLGLRSVAKWGKGPGRLCGKPRIRLKDPKRMSSCATNYNILSPMTET